MSRKGGGRHTPKRRRCRDCAYEPPFLRVSSRCPPMQGHNAGNSLQLSDRYGWDGLS